MCPTPAPAGRHWDGSSRATRRPRPLRVTAHVPESCRWHLSGGIAYPHGDNSARCRIPHAVLCPRRIPTCRPSPHIEVIRRQLAVRTRRLIDTGAFAPAAPAGRRPATRTGESGRPVVQMLLCRYLAQERIEDLSCVAPTRNRHRCPDPVLAPAGHQRGQPAPPDTLMAVYGLGHLRYGEQLRWRAQRCTAHATAGLALAGREPFDPLLHAAHIHTRLPHSPPRPHRRG
ncbi:DUF6083 domain-containing protein [Streptomyces sp. NPDC001840]